MRIIAIGAHPDDVEFSVAPLLIKEVNRGNSVKIVICSLGEAGTNGTPAGRKKEAEDAAKSIGAEIELLHMGGDCHIEYKPQNGITIAKVLRHFKPDVVLAPSLAENQHPDHVTVAKLTRNAARFARYGGLAELTDWPIHSIGSLYYYNSGAEWEKKPDIIVDVTDVEEQWKRTMSCHESQLKTKQYFNLIFSKAAALGATCGVKLAVGFYINDPIRINLLSDLNLSSRNY